MEKYFKRMAPKSKILPSVIMKISYKNTKKKSVYKVLVQQESDIDKAKNIFKDKYKLHDIDTIEDISLSLDKNGAPLVGNGGVDFKDEEELDNIFFVFKIQYKDRIVNIIQE